MSPPPGWFGGLKILTENRKRDPSDIIIAESEGISVGVELEPRQWDLRLYTDHPDNYIAAAAVLVDGERAILTHLNGLGFYEHVAEVLDAVYRELGIQVIEAHVTVPHARLARQALRHRYHVIERPARCAGRQMVRLEIRRI